MKKFLDEIKKGNFVISKCKNCNVVVWPPSEFCNQCLSQTTWEKISEVGEVKEFSKKENEYFGLVEFEEKIRIIGKINGGSEPKIGGKIKIKECSVIEENPRFLFETVSE